MKAKLFTTAITLGLFITPILSANASVFPQPVYNDKGQVIGTTKALPIKPLPIPATEINLSADQSVLDTIEDDVTGDSITDTIYLSGHKGQPNSQYVDNVSITVKNGADNSLNTVLLSKVGGYQPHLFTGDFSGDKVPDVYVATASGGSGGWSYYNVVSFNNNTPKEIFSTKDTQNQSITGRFIDGWKAELTNSINGKTLAIDVSSHQNDYLRLGIYNQAGVVQRETQTMIAPFGKLDPIDVDNDGVFELKGVQRISGAYRADGLADVETTLKYDGAAWKTQSIKITVNMDTPNADIAKPTPLPAHLITSEKKLLETESAKISYPQFANLDSYVTLGIVNTEIEKTAIEYSKQGDPGSKTEIDYKITRQDKDIISVLFTGYQTWEGGKYDLMRSVNIDLKARRMVNAKNLFREDESAKLGITALLKEAAVNNPAITNPPTFGDWMGVYFTDDSAVFFYLANDFAKEHVQLTVPLDRLKQYMN